MKDLCLLAVDVAVTIPDAPVPGMVLLVARAGLDGPAA